VQLHGVYCTSTAGVLSRAQIPEYVKRCVVAYSGKALNLRSKGRGFNFHRDKAA